MLNGRHDTCQSLWKQDYTRSTFSSSIGEGLYTLARFHSVWKSLTMLHLGFSIFKNSPKWSIFAIFYELLSVQNVNLLAARNDECDNFWDFQTLCASSLTLRCPASSAQTPIETLWVWTRRKLHLSRQSQLRHQSEASYVYILSWQKIH